jgi:hypothetical protein
MPDPASPDVWYTYDIDYITCAGGQDYKTIFPSDYRKHRLTPEEVWTIALKKKSNGMWQKVVAITETKHETTEIVCPQSLPQSNTRP